jgi:hypothetical protein
MKTPWRHVDGLVPICEGAWEETGRNPGYGFRWRALEGQSPGEQPAGDVLNTRCPFGVLARIKTRKLRLAGPAHRSRGGSYWREKRYAGQCSAETPDMPHEWKGFEGRIP